MRLTSDEVVDAVLNRFRDASSAAEQRGVARQHLTELWASSAEPDDGRLLTVALLCEASEYERWQLAAPEAALQAWFAARPELAGSVSEGQVAVGHPGQLRYWREGSCVWLDGNMQAVCAGRPAQLLLPGGAADEPWLLLEAAEVSQNPHQQPLLDGRSTVWRWSFRQHALPDDAAIRSIGLPADLADRAEVLAAVLATAGLVGIGQRGLDLAVEHASEREQFGRPLSAFQAVAHRLADMFCTVELVRSAVHAAGAQHLADGSPRPAAAAIAQLLGARHLPGVVQQAIHVFGALGLTAHTPLHVLLRRSLVLRLAGGGTAAATERLVAELAALATGKPAVPMTSAGTRKEARC